MNDQKSFIAHQLDDDFRRQAMLMKSIAQDRIKLEQYKRDSAQHIRAIKIISGSLIAIILFIVFALYQICDQWK